MITAKDVNEITMSIEFGVVVWLLASWFDWLFGLNYTPGDEAILGLWAGLGSLLVMWTEGKIILWTFCAIFIAILLEQLGFVK